ncbi:MAG: FAD-binding oxidoreductase, partial [Caldilineae bacterium]
MDFVVVGGGVYGCGVSWHLAKRGAEVLLIEANVVASGASGGPGKRGVRASGRDLRELPLMRRAYELWPRLAEELGGPTGYERIGGLTLIEREREYTGAPARVWVQEQFGIPTRLVEGPELRELEPHLTDRVRAALYCPKDGVADHTATCVSWARAAERLGVECREHTPVTGLEVENGRVVAIHTALDERIPVDIALILCTNTHVPQLLQEQFELTLPVWRRLPQVLLTEPLTPPPVRHLIGHAHRRLALKALPDNRVMISGGWLGRVDPVTGQPLVDADAVIGNRAEAAAVYPALANAPIALVSVDRWESESVDGI